jgi:hypothetical protein
MTTATATSHDEHSGEMAALCRHLIEDPAQEWIRADDDEDEDDGLPDVPHFPIYLCVECHCRESEELMDQISLLCACCVQKLREGHHAE